MARASNGLAEFLAKVDIGEPGVCWEWLAGKDKDGYGKFRSANRHLRAHRYAYEALVGPIPDGLVIDHLCRNTSCVNPAHLEPVTWAENLHRGNSIQARYARNELCPRGHEYTAMQGSYRRCRECANQKRRERRARVKEQAHGTR